MHILSYNSFVSYQCEDTVAFEILFDYDKYNKVQQWIELPGEWKYVKYIVC